MQMNMCDKDEVETARNVGPGGGMPPGSPPDAGSAHLAVQEHGRPLEELVARVLAERAACDVNLTQEEHLTPGQHLADSVARMAGSWGFIALFLAFLAVWMVVNAKAGLNHWDPYPFILLNLVLSCIAAIQAPVIMMSQSRQETRDRLRAESDYRVNVKAEILLEHLTEEIEDIKGVLTSLEARQPPD
jgi:uncharacterized membrane protein